MNLKKTVYLVRHGESEANVAPVFQAPNSPLSEKGQKQAHHVAERVAKLDFDALIVSPMLRAQQTAAAITELTHKTPEFSELFVERIKPTSINGKPYTDPEASSTWRAWDKSLHETGVRVEDGENFDDLVARANKALDLLRDHPAQSLVVVTHGYFLRTIVARVVLADALTGDAHRRFQQHVSMENTGLTVLRYRDDFEQDARWRLWIYNDHAHLG